MDTGTHSQPDTGAGLVGAQLVKRRKLYVKGHDSDLGPMHGAILPDGPCMLGPITLKEISSW